jgi:molecular chaperone GrpE (heat shock protein)
MLMSAEEGDRRLEKLKVAIVSSATAESQRWAEPIVARLATECWRLGQRLDRVREASELKPVRESLARIDDIFAENQIQTIDHEGQPYDPGLLVEVLHEREGDGPRIILETVRPTVTLAGQVIQHAQVVVGPHDTGRG